MKRGEREPGGEEEEEAEEEEGRRRGWERVKGGRGVGDAYNVRSQNDYLGFGVVACRLAWW